MKEQKLFKKLFVKVRLVRENNQSYKLVNNANDVIPVLRETMGVYDREHIVALYLNCKNQLVAIEETSIGTTSSCLVSPKEIFKTALLSNAAGVVLTHNHPTGDPTPSDNDIKFTHELISAGKILGVDVVDHIVIGEGKYVSLKEKGLI